MSKLSQKQRVFAKIFAKTRDVKNALYQAGYQNNPHQAKSIITNPAVMAEIRKEQEQILMEKGLNMAVQAHLKLIASDETKPSVLLQAIKLMYDRTLKEQKEEISEKSLSEMSFNEIQTLLEKLRTKKEQNIIEVTPLS